MFISKMLSFQTLSLTLSGCENCENEKPVPTRLQSQGIRTKIVYSYEHMITICLGLRVNLQ